MRCAGGTLATVAAFAPAFTTFATFTAGAALATGGLLGGLVVCTACGVGTFHLSLCGVVVAVQACVLAAGFGVAAAATATVTSIAAAFASFALGAAVAVARCAAFG